MWTSKVVSAFFTYLLILDWRNTHGNLCIDYKHAMTYLNGHSLAGSEKKCIEHIVGLKIYMYIPLSTMMAVFTKRAIYFLFSKTRFLLPLPYYYSYLCMHEDFARQSCKRLLREF